MLFRLCNSRGAKRAWLYVVSGYTPPVVFNQEAIFRLIPPLQCAHAGRVDTSLPVSHRWCVG